MQITAAVFRQVHQPLTIETVDIDQPRGREVLVRTAATGVCHSDLHVIDGLGEFLNVGHVRRVGCGGNMFAARGLLVRIEWGDDEAWLSASRLRRLVPAARAGLVPPSS